MIKLKETNRYWEVKEVLSIFLSQAIGPPSSTFLDKNYIVIFLILCLKCVTKIYFKNF